MSRAQIAAIHQQLITHQRAMSDSSTRIADLFLQDPQRFASFSVLHADILFDFSKNLLTRETLALLLKLAQACDLQEAIAAMYRGDPINNTENRPALHVALRGHRPASVAEAAQAVDDCLQRMEEFVNAVHQQRWLGYDGRAITDVVNIGIGGSDLGPAMVTEALTAWHVPGIRCHFVSNVDPCHLHDTCSTLNPATTLFIIASKTFTTLETMQNAVLARRWYHAGGGDGALLARHFVAATASPAKAAEFGIPAENIFPLWDWVGGRYSLWSAIGLPIALAVGMPGFRDLLRGGAIMDQHFHTAELSRNIPVLMGLLNVWYRNYWGASSQVILPYAQNLHLFPAFLQQLDMESLGKSVTRHGKPVATKTGMVIWGSAGTNGQHSFHQLLHQGCDLIPADFITAAVSSCAEDQAQHQHLLGNCFSQSQALMLGNSAADPHKAVAGNRPSNTLLLRQLTPQTLGSLIALYEHRVYVQSVIWDINAFDQWGVEIGKQLSGKMYPALQSTEGDTTDCQQFDAATNGLINQYRRFLL